jgi:hypothetical protein
LEKSISGCCSINLDLNTMKISENQWTTWLTFWEYLASFVRLMWAVPFPSVVDRTSFSLPSIEFRHPNHPTKINNKSDKFSTLWMHIQCGHKWSLVALNLLHCLQSKKCLESQTIQLIATWCANLSYKFGVLLLSSPAALSLCWFQDLWGQFCSTTPSCWPAIVTSWENVWNSAKNQPFQCWEWALYDPQCTTLTLPPWDHWRSLHQWWEVVLLGRLSDADNEIIFEKYQNWL